MKKKDRNGLGEKLELCLLWLPHNLKIKSTYKDNIQGKIPAVLSHINCSENATILQILKQNFEGNHSETLPVLGHNM